tara:strand:- start:548 stop:916 length:369 start_codon:yes stop_codon:yes gene_type:complete
MKKLIIISIPVFFLFSCSSDEADEQPLPQETYITISTSGMNFVPNEVICNVGDTIQFIMSSSHNAVEVSQSNYENNNPTALDGGFNVNYGQTSFFVPNEAKTHYYVCQPHIFNGMIGKIIVQ